MIEEKNCFRKYYIANEKLYEISFDVPCHDLIDWGPFTDEDTKQFEFTNWKFSFIINGRLSSNAFPIHNLSYLHDMRLLFCKTNYLIENNNKCDPIKQSEGLLKWHVIILGFSIYLNRWLRVYVQSMDSWQLSQGFFICVLWLMFVWIALYVDLLWI